jgi:hypothetical protein
MFMVEENSAKILVKLAPGNHSTTWFDTGGLEALLCRVKAVTLNMMWEARW